jgi:FkbM family methyltransferase
MLEGDGEIGMCGSTILLYNEPEKIWALGGATYHKWFAIPRCVGLYQSVHRTFERKWVESRIDYIAGASMFVSRSFVECIGLMSEEYFLYFEEIDWIIRAQGRFTLAYAPKSIVYHKVGSATGYGAGRKRNFISDYYGIRNRLILTRQFFPICLPTVYLRLFVTLLNRIRQRQWSRVWMIVDIMMQSGGIFPKSILPPLRYYFHKLRGSLEKELLKLNELVDKGERAIDIGAGYGVYTYVLSKLCDQVEAFEPQPQCAEVIEAYSHYLRKRGKNNINVHRVGLSNAAGHLTLRIPVKNDRRLSGYATFKDLEGTYESIKVPAYKLDDFHFNNVSFVKIDVEGYESEVLQGARETIVREKPLILIEIEQRHNSHRPITEIFDEIVSLGYEGVFLYRNEFVPLSKFSYTKHQQPYLNNVMCKDYVNNFIFKSVRKL